METVGLFSGVLLFSGTVPSTRSKNLTLRLGLIFLQDKIYCSFLLYDNKQIYKRITKINTNHEKTTKILYNEK